MKTMFNYWHMARVQARRYSSKTMLKYNIQQYTWFNDIYTYDTVFVKANEREPGAIGVVCPPLKPLPACTIYVVYLNADGFGRGHTEHEEIHLRHCRIFDKEMNNLKEEDKKSFLQSDRYQTQFRYFTLYESIWIDKKVICMQQAIDYCLEYSANTKQPAYQQVCVKEVANLPTYMDKIKSPAKRTSHEGTSVPPKKEKKSCQIPKSRVKRSKDTYAAKSVRKRKSESQVEISKRKQKKKILAMMTKLYNL